MQITPQITEYDTSKIFYVQKSTNIYTDVKLKLEELIQNMFSTPELTKEEEINNKFLNLDFGSEFDIDASKIGVNDAIFFVNLLNENSIINYKTEDDSIKLDINNKTIEATKSLLNMLQTSYDTKKPIRLDFENDVTVILKLDKEGKIQAHFIPGTSTVEAYLKNNIPSLKETFEQENIGYSYLGYSKKENKNSKKRSNK